MSGWRWARPDVVYAVHDVQLAQHGGLPDIRDLMRCGPHWRGRQAEGGMTDLLDEIHPGEILLEEFMKPLGITGQKLAADIDVPPSRISDIVNGKRPISADTALRLSIFLIWMRATG